MTENNSTVLTTIPYDSGWKIKVDGKKVDTYETLDALLAFDLASEGNHKITMKYFPNCYIVGIIISVISALIFIAVLVAVKMLKDGKLNFKRNSRIFKVSNVLVSLPTDKCSEEYSLIDLEIKEEQEILERLNKKNKNQKKNKDKK